MQSGRQPCSSRSGRVGSDVRVVLRLIGKEWQTVMIAIRSGDSAIEQPTTSDIVQPTLPKRFIRFSMASDRPSGSSPQMWEREPESRRVCSANEEFAS